MSKINYLQGFGNHFASEALAGALPQGQNAPQKLKFNLYTEQLSGSAFTAPNESTLKSWLYRIQPSVVHGTFQLSDEDFPGFIFKPKTPLPPNQLRFDPIDMPKAKTQFIQGLKAFAACGNLRMNQGAMVYLYACNTDMEDSYFFSQDGELLIVPQTGSLSIDTEFGLIEVCEEEIAVIPKGVKFQVKINTDCAKGYVLLNYGPPFKLPERGLIGANSLANERDFLYPEAKYDNTAKNCVLYSQFQGHLWQCEMNHSPLNVVAWHGNYAPYKYPLKYFNTINSVSFDHPDPSIFTVLTAPGTIAGTANLDFVIFPERWQVAEHTFRPPYFHRNKMSEFMGLIKGEYDAKAKGFVPGGVSIHNCMSAHGPDAKSYQMATKANLQPKYIKNTLAFMFESQFVWQVSEIAFESLQENYQDCWAGLDNHFM